MYDGRERQEGPIMLDLQLGSVSLKPLSSCLLCVFHLVQLDVAC